MSDNEPFCGLCGDRHRGPCGVPIHMECAPALPQRVLAMCKKRDWSLHWSARGCYLHLESSELIEAIRGKHGDPTLEAADVLIVLMSITENAGIPWDDVLNAAGAKVTALETRPRYEGEAVSEIQEKL